MSFNNSERVSGLMKVVHRVRDGLSIYYRPLGLRGVLAISTHRLFCWPKELRERPLGIRKPVHLRMRTTDNIWMASIYYANKNPDAKIIAVEAEASNSCYPDSQCQALPQHHCDPCSPVESRW